MRAAAVALAGLVGDDDEEAMLVDKHGDGGRVGGACGSVGCVW